MRSTRAALASGIAAGLVVTLLILSSAPFGAGTALVKPVSHSPAGRTPVGALRRSITPAALPTDPANCTQGDRTIHANPGSGDMEPTLLSDFSTLGKEGGGTIDLAAGTFYLNETLNLARYSNVSFQGTGVGRTILSVPPVPIGSYHSDNGTPVGLYNTTTGGPVNGTAVNLIQVSGSQAVNNFEMCDLTLDAQANNASEDWAGSLIMDISGGYHHVYSDISEVGFFGPSTTPNGLHLETSPFPQNPGMGYVIDNLQASDNSVPFTNYPGYRGGPNFLNVGAVANCTLDRVDGIGLAAFEMSPPQGCLVENWNVRGHMLVDPSAGGTWGGTFFQNVTVNASGTAAPNALDIDVANSTSNGGSNFTELRWNDSRFVGQVLDAVNMVDVENSTFSTGLNSTPSVFEHDTVAWNPNGSQNPAPLPIRADGVPAGGLSSVVANDVFLFPNGTGKCDPFLLTVPEVSWSNLTVGIAGATNGYLLNAPSVAIAPYSTFAEITYDSLGNGSPPALVLFDIVGSPGYQDRGAVVGPLTGVYDDLPAMVPSMPAGLTALAKGIREVTLGWNASSGPVTNYTLWVENTSSSVAVGYSAGRETTYVASGLAPDTDYQFAVEAWNSSLHSAASVPISVVTPPVPRYAPGVPTGVIAKALGATQVAVQWTPSTGNVTNYTVYAGSQEANLVDSYSAGTTTSWTVSGLGPNTTYYFAVEAWNGSWASGRSTAVNVTTPTIGVSPPPPAPAPGSMALMAWLMVFGVILGSVGAVVLPMVVVSVIRSRSAAREKARSPPRRASPVRSDRLRGSSRGSLPRPAGPNSASIRRE